MVKKKTRGAWKITVRGSGGNHDADTLNSRCKPTYSKPHPKSDKQNMSERRDEE